MAGKTGTLLEYRSLLYFIAYNMLGTVDAAEDMEQDTYLKWMDSEGSDIRFVKSYLVKRILEIVRVQNGQYAEHWSIWNFQKVIAQIEPDAR